MERNYIDRVAFIEIHDKKLLEVRDKDKTTWYTPGGKVRAGENDIQALVREIKEELGVDVDIKTIKYYETFEAQAHGKPEGVITRMTCYQAKYSGELSPGFEVEEMDWFNYSKRELTSALNQLVFDDLKSKNLID